MAKYVSRYPVSSVFRKYQTKNYDMIPLYTYMKEWLSEKEKNSKVDKDRITRTPYIVLTYILLKPL